MIEAEIKSANIFKFDSKLYIKTPKLADNAVTPSIVKMVLIKSKLTKLRFFNIERFNIDEIIDIKIYPTINANVPIYLGRKYIQEIKTADEIA